MLSLYEKNKKNIYKWREKDENKRRQCEINKKCNIKYYAWKRAQKEFLHILIII